MPETTTSKSANDAAAQLAALIRATGCEPRMTEPEARSSGYFSAIDFAEQAGVSPVHARDLLLIGIRRGTVERIKVGKAYFYRPFNQ